MLPHPSRILNTSFNKSENLLLGSVAVCLSLLLVRQTTTPDRYSINYVIFTIFPHLHGAWQFAEMLKASLELGCFLAGVAISSQGPAVVDPVSDELQRVLYLF